MQKDIETVLVLFGSTGDLARRKVVPALCSLHAKKLLLENFSILAYSRRHWSDEEYREFIRPSLTAFPPGVVESFLKIIQHIEGVFDDPSGFLELKKKIDPADALFYLAVQPELHPQIIKQLGKASLQGKLLVEKPFGHDLASAEQLEKIAEKYFPPEHIFRIDHYLGKDGLMALREHAPGGDIASIMCRIFETLGVEGRGAFYDAVGALRDVGQSHLLQMLNTLVPIESLMPPTNIVRGQYEGYASEPNIEKDSQTETFFRITTQSSDPHWRGVPLVLEAGKALAAKKSEVEIVFKDGSRKLFPMDPFGRDLGHETIIQAALRPACAGRGNQSYFVPLKDVLASWRFAESVLERFSSTPLTVYKKGVDESAIV